MFEFEIRPTDSTDRSTPGNLPVDQPWIISTLKGTPDSARFGEPCKINGMAIQPQEWVIVEGPTLIRSRFSQSDYCRLEKTFGKTFGGDCKWLYGPRWAVALFWDEQATLTSFPEEEYIDVARKHGKIIQCGRTSLT